MIAYGGKASGQYAALRTPKNSTGAVFGIVSLFAAARANRKMFEEGVEVLFKAFEGKPFSHKGKYHTIPPEVSFRA